MMPYFKEFAEFCHMKAGMEKLCRLNLTHFERFLGTIGNPAIVTPQIMVQWVQWEFTNNQNPNQIISRRATISRYYRYLVRIGVVERSPVDLEMLPKIAQRRPERFAFSEDQYKTVLEATAKHKESWWHNACVVAWGTGLRLSDVTQISKAAIDIKERILRFVPHKTRDVKPDPVDMPIDNDTWVAIVNQYNDRTWGDHTHIFPAMLNRFVLEGNTNTLGNQFIKICKAAGLINHSFHSFRHSFITRMLEGGMDTTMLCSITGLHPAMIATYAHISVDAKRKAMHSASLMLAQKESFNPEPTVLSIVPAA